MKKISLYALAIGIACWTGAALTSCSTFGPDEPGAGDGPYISLTFSKAATDAEGNPALTVDEQHMETVDLFLYPKDDAEKNGSVRPVLYRFENTSHNTTHVISISDAELLALFGVDNSASSGTYECVVFAAANVPDACYEASGVNKNEALPEDLQKVKARTPSFAAEFGSDLAMFSSKPEGDVITYDAANKKATGTINLKNLAAKIDLLVNFGTNVTGVNPNDGSKEPQTWNVATNGNNPTAEVHILNGVMAVRLDGSMPVLTEEDYYSIRFDNEEHIRTVAPLGSEDPAFDAEKTWYATSAPYYSYPNVWEDSPLEQHRTSLLLKVDWTVLDPEMAGPADLLTTYYNVPLALDANELESNRYYRVKVNINTLGGQNFGEPLDIEASVEVLDWGKAELEADIREIRYLEIARKVLHIDGNTYAAVLNNSTYTTIPYHTSHGVEVESVKITYYDIYKPGDDGSGEAVVDQNMTTSAQIDPFLLKREEVENPGAVGMYIDPIAHTVTLNHPLYPIELKNGKYASTGAEKYSRFLIEIRLRHADSPSTYADIVIMQYPASYASISPNSGGDTNAIRNRDRGWVFVNGGINDFGGVNGIATGPLSSWLEGGVLGYSTNPNMYVVTVTNLNASNKPLHLGDPRMKRAMQNQLETRSIVIGEYMSIVTRYDLNSYDNLLPSTQDDSGANAAWATTAPKWKDGKSISDTGYLTDYYPTDETPSEEYIYMLSPQFRVGSSYGTHDNTINRNDARKRCASYQEDGYPAGRWRLPTVGELQYMATLSQEKIIPTLFSSSRGYWTSHGLYQVQDGTLTEVTDLTGWLSSIFNDGMVSGAGNNGRLVGYTRCVYDEWYWTYVDADGNEHPDRLTNDKKGTFYWGDKPKDNPQVQTDPANN